MAPLKHPRRKFLQFGTTGFLAGLFGSIPGLSLASPPLQNNEGIVVHENEGIHILTGRRKVPINIKISKQKDKVAGISFCMEDMDPGRKMRVHKHLYHDELIFIHRGEGTLTLGEESITVKTGSVAFVPRGVWHGLDNIGTGQLLMVFQYTPAGFEEYFIENGTLEGMPSKERTADEYRATEKKYGMVYRDIQDGK